MAQHEVTRTLVKSQPEVWTQCSDADSLGRHLNGSFGEIRITQLEPEHSVAWEGEEVSGTVRIEPSAWGTRVTLTVEVAEEIAALEQELPPAPVVEGQQEPPELVEEEEPLPEPDLEDTAEPEERLGFLARLRARFRRAPAEEAPAEETPPAPEEQLAEAAEPDPEPVPALEAPAAPADPEPDPQEPGAPTLDTAAALNAALESLGQAHHRPFSRA